VLGNDQIEIFVFIGMKCLLRTLGGLLEEPEEVLVVLLEEPEEVLFVLLEEPEEVLVILLEEPEEELFIVNKLVAACLVLEDIGLLVVVDFFVRVVFGILSFSSFFVTSILI